jgi:hypothetical protein
MSATLTWFHHQGAKTGTTSAALITDLAAMVNAKLADANYSWRVASSQSATSPYYCVLKRKDGSAGRILFVIWTSAPAGNNAAILTGTPTNDHLYYTWFPAGNTDTPLNLTAASGTILGDDTGALYVGGTFQLTTVYGASAQPHYFDSAEGIAFGLQNPASTSLYGGFIGKVLVDAADTAYDAMLYAGGSSLANFGALGSPSLAWMPASTSFAHNVSNQHIRANYGGNNKLFFQAWAASGWGNLAVGSNDILTDTALSKAWFVPYPLAGHTKGQGFPLKLRQIAFGPGVTGPFAAYSSGGVVQARCMAAATLGSNGYPWLTNFKL